MPESLKNKQNLKTIIPALVVVIIVLGYFVWNISSDRKNISGKLSNTENSLSETQNQLTELQNENNQLKEALDTEQRRNDDFEDQISQISGTVGDLEKLSKTDPELLQKYSKVYFLNEHYTPPSLTNIDEKYIITSKTLQIHSGVWPFLKKLLIDASEDGVNLRIVSSYRSFNEQASLKSNYTVTYGSGANTFSADQGYSEHQLGTTVDFTTEELGSNFTSFESTEAYKWLIDNAYKYGFVLSYPKGNQYYIFEPWHWRFVSKDLARDLHKADSTFYEWDQRDIDEYLIDFFD